MKKLSPLIVWALICCANPVQAQSSCDKLVEVMSENFDTFNEGLLSSQSEFWTTFSGVEGGDEDGVVASLVVNSEPNSLAFGDAYGSTSQNALLKIGDVSEGIVMVEFSIYVVPSMRAQFGGQHLAGDPGTEEAFNVVLGVDGVGQLNNGSQEEIIFNYDQEEWLNVRMRFDLDNDFAYLIIDSDFIAGWPVSRNSDGSSGAKSLASINFKTTTIEDLYFVDDVVVNTTPSAVNGKFCHLASPIDVGVHSVGTLECYGAGFTIRDEGQGSKGEWFSYTAPADGVISVGSCNSGADTRVWIFSGGCEGLRIEGVNDDQCLIEDGSDDNYASYKEVIVKENETYLILWDDVWEEGNFTFELSFSDAELIAGNFCQSAIVLANGQITIDEINGHGAVSGPDINHTSASTTNYAKSEWYTFTPSSDGFINIATCFLTSVDTRLYIYKGTCGLENLELIAFDDDGCGLQSIVADMPVEADNQYYFEWDDESLESPGFDFLFEFETASSIKNLLTFGDQVDVFPNPASEYATIELDFESPADIRIELFDNIGRRCQGVQLENVFKKDYKLDLQDSQAGVYFVKVSVEGYETFLRKLIVNQ